MKLSWTKSTPKPERIPSKWRAYSDDASSVDWSCEVERDFDPRRGFAWKVHGEGWKFFGPNAVKRVDDPYRDDSEICCLEFSGFSTTREGAQEDCEAALKVLLDTYKRMQERACGKNKRRKKT